MQINTRLFVNHVQINRLKVVQIKGLCQCASQEHEKQCPKT